MVFVGIKEFDVELFIGSWIDYFVVIQLIFGFVQQFDCFVQVFVYVLW